MKYRFIMTKLIIFNMVILIIGNNCSFKKDKKILFDIDDFLIININYNDLINNKIDTYDLNKARYEARELHCKFLKKVNNKSEYVFLDFWYPDFGVKKIDKKLKDIMNKIDNLSFCYAGFYNNNFELTLNYFSNCIKDNAHTIFYFNDYYELSYNKVEYFNNKPIKHVSYIILEYFDIPTKNKDINFIKISDLKRIKTISYSEFMKDKIQWRDKILFLTSDYNVNDDDIYELPLIGKISGSEILCNFIIHAQSGKVILN